MAAELTTGALVMYQIKKSGKNISMLVANNKGNFTKKAKGRITFTCNDGTIIEDAIKKTIATGEGLSLIHIKMCIRGSVEPADSAVDFKWFPILS